MPVASEPAPVAVEPTPHTHTHTDTDTDTDTDTGAGCRYRHRHPLWPMPLAAHPFRPPHLCLCRAAFSAGAGTVGIAAARSREPGRPPAIARARSRRPAQSAAETTTPTFCRCRSQTRQVQ